MYSENMNSYFFPFQVTIGVGSLNFLANGLQHTLITREIQDLDEKLKNIETMLTSACTQVNYFMSQYSSINLIFQFDSLEISILVFPILKI